MEAQSEYVHVACTFLHVWPPICMLGRCLVTTISASDLSRKFVKCALLVGYFYPLSSDKKGPDLGHVGTTFMCAGE